MGTLLRFAGVAKAFGSRRGSLVHALREIDLDLEAGEVVGLVGPDGAGKTTLLRIACGLLVPDEGRATVLDLDSVHDTLEIRSRIGYMPQKFGLYEDLTVRENMVLHADLQGVPGSERGARFDQLLEMTDLARFTGRLAGKLSGGMKQKLGLACALIKAPQLLLLDEPTVGVDPVSRRDLWRIVDQLVDDGDIGVLVSTAYLDEAERCDRVAVMFDGRIVDRGPPDDFSLRVRDRVLEIEADDERGARSLQVELARRQEVIDATIVSGRVRVVLDSEGDGLASDAPGSDAARACDPRFEDAFMDLAHRHVERDVDEMSDGNTSDGPATTSTNDEPVVSVRHLVKRFGEFTAVDDVSFDVHRGQVFGLLGPNGAGKTTTFRMLCGLLPATSGSLTVAGRDVREGAAEARRRIGYMAQRFSMYGNLSVDANLVFFGRAYGLGRTRLRARIEQAHEEFGLGPWRRHAAGALPGGYKQRLAMAAALLHEPDVLFLDEPTSGVDPLARREFWRRINAVAVGGVTVIVTTHFMEEAEYCDRMLIQQQGRPLALGRPGDVRALARTDERPDPTIEDAFVALALEEVSPVGTPVDPAGQLGDAAAEAGA